MTVSQAIGDDLCQKLRMVGLPKEFVLPLVNSLTRQVLAEGPESVVRRLKVLKQAAVDTLGGHDPKFHWIAHTSSGPKGPWKPIWQMLKSSSFKHKKRAFNAMMVYASLVLPKRAGPTLVQAKKFLESVQHTSEELHLRGQRLAEAQQRGMFRKGFAQLRHMLRSSGWHPDKDNIIPDVLVYFAKRYGTEKEAVQKREQQLASFLGGQCGLAFHAYPQVKTALGEIGEDYFSLTHPWNGAHLDWRDTKPDLAQTVGVIGSTQEPGYKFRAFASPNPVVQCAMEGFKRNLLHALELLPWDCTHNQERGVDHVVQWLKEGHTIHSVDLSDATNNFPFDLQRDLLLYLGASEQDVKLLELVSRSPYRLMWDKDTTVTWDVGQPLGAGPSFMAFALAHAAVALDAELEVGVPPGTTFLILGDDFVTCDDKVHRAYRSRLEALSCPISESKCLSSNLAAEFAGKLITHSNVYHGYKFREVSDISFMSVVRTLGRQAVSRTLLTEQQFKYCKLVAEMPEPWGLGFNPKGRPFADRYADYLEFAEHTKLKEPIRISSEQLKTKWLCAAKHRVWGYYPVTERPVVPRPPETPSGVKARIWETLVPGGSQVAVSHGDPRPRPVNLNLAGQSLRKIWDGIYGKANDSATLSARMRAKEVSRTSKVEATAVSDPPITEGQTKSESSTAAAPSLERVATSRRLKPDSSGPGF